MAVEFQNLDADTRLCVFLLCALRNPRVKQPWSVSKERRAKAVLRWKEKKQRRLMAIHRKDADGFLVVNKQIAKKEKALRKNMAKATSAQKKKKVEKNDNEVKKAVVPKKTQTQSKSQVKKKKHYGGVDFNKLNAALEQVVADRGNEDPNKNVSKQDPTTSTLSDTESEKSTSVV